MKTLIYCSIASLIIFGYALNLEAQTVFPKLQAETIQSEPLSIPESLEGKKSILFLAFSQRAETVLSDWYEPVYTLFLDKSGINALAYDCHVKLIMMFTGAGQALSKQVIDNVRSQTDDEYADYLLFYTGEFKEEMERLGISQKQDAYVFVLDEQGHIIYQSQGKYSEEKLEEIADLVEL